MPGLNPTFHSALQRIIRHCLEKSPQERYQSASDIAFDLEMLADPASDAPGSAGSQTQRTRNASAGSLQRLLSLAVLALALLIFAAHPPMGRLVHVSLSPPEKMTFTSGTGPGYFP